MGEGTFEGGVQNRDENQFIVYLHSKKRKRHKQNLEYWIVQTQTEFASIGDIW